jgi:hypothetical protein
LYDTYTRSSFVIYSCVTLWLTISDRGQPEDLFPESENLMMMDVEAMILRGEITYAALLSVT